MFADNPFYSQWALKVNSVQELTEISIAHYLKPQLASAAFIRQATSLENTTE
jgi:hypothetical protein